MSIYTDEGWLDMDGILSKGQPFNYMTGARGVGKTYGALRYAITHSMKFFFLRRTTAEMLMITSIPDLNPFNAINRDLGTHYDFFKMGADIWTVCPYEDVDGKRQKCGESIGIAISLSAMAKIRGFSSEDIDLIIYDEFIPESHVRPLRDEGMAWANAIESINRNRELLGKPPCLVVAMSNSNRLDNEIYMFLGLVSTVVKMQKSGTELMVIPERAMTLVNIQKSPISNQKRTTALYRHTAGTEFASMALDNEYIGESDREDTTSRPIREYRPVCTVGEITIYEHKHRHEYYCTTFRTGSAPVFTASDKGLERWRHEFPQIRWWYLENCIRFESRVSEVLLARYLTHR